MPPNTIYRVDNRALGYSSITGIYIYISFRKYVYFTCFTRTKLDIFFFLFVRIDDYYFIEYFIDLNDEIIIGSKVIENDSMADTEDGRES